jgi:WD40 repeat protein
VRTGDALEIAALQTGEITAFAWSPSGEHLLTLAREGDSQYVLARWNGDARTKLETLAVPPAAAPQLAVHPGGEAVCVAPGHNVYHIAAGPNAELSPLKLEGVSDVRLAALSPDGSRLWLVEGTERVSLWDVPQEGLAGDLKPAGEYTTQGMDILLGRGNILCLAAAGERAFVGLDNGLVMGMNAASPDPDGIWSTQATRVEAIAVRGDGELIAAGTDRGAVEVFRPDGDGIETRFAPFARRGVASLAFDARGEFLAVGSITGEVQLWRRTAQGYERLATLREADGRAASLRFHPSRPGLAVHVAGERGLRVWRLDVLNEALRDVGAAW